MNKLPIIIFIALLALFSIPLLKGKDPSIVSSPLIGKPAPALAIKGLSDGDLKGEVSIMNFFASWCVSCRAEQATFDRMAKDGITIYGINYKDTPEKLKAWLSAFGNPYKKIGDDKDGRTAIDWGVYGVPETYVVDANGIIRYKHIGPVTERDYETVFKPLLEGIKK